MGVVSAAESSFHTVFLYPVLLCLANIVAFMFVPVLKNSQVGGKFWSPLLCLAGSYSCTSHLRQWITRSYVLGNWMYSDRTRCCLHWPLQLHPLDPEHYFYPINCHTAPLTRLRPSWSTATALHSSVPVCPRGDWSFKSDHWWLLGGGMALVSLTVSLLSPNQ